jgi:hypothetical protein
MGNRKMQMRKLRTKNRITRSEAMAFRTRWKIINALEKQELCNTSIDEKLGQLAILMISAKKLGWTKALEVGAEQVRDRWNRLRRVYHG